MRKLLLGTAIAVALSTAGHAQTAAEDVKSNPEDVNQSLSQSELYAGIWKGDNGLTKWTSEWVSASESDGKCYWWVRQEFEYADGVSGTPERPIQRYYRTKIPCEQPPPKVPDITSNFVMLASPPVTQPLPPPVTPLCPARTDWIKNYIVTFSPLVEAFYYADGTIILCRDLQEEARATPGYGYDDEPDTFHPRPLKREETVLPRHEESSKSSSDIRKPAGRTETADHKPTGTPEKSDPKSDLRPTGTPEKSDRRPTGNAEKSEAKPNSNSEHSYGKPANNGERANAKPENASEHATRTVAHQPEESHQVAHATGAGSMSGMHEGATHEVVTHEGATHVGGLAETHAGGPGGTHLGGLGSLHSGLAGMHTGGLGGMHLGGLGGFHLGGGFAGMRLGHFGRF
jgi:hypothetical protein